MNATQKALTVYQYARKKGLCPNTVYRWIKNGMPKLNKPTGKPLRPYTLMIDEKAADAWLQKCTAGKGVEA